MAADGTADMESMQMSLLEHRQMLDFCFRYWLDRNDPNFRIRDIDNYVSGVLQVPSTTCTYSGNCHLFLSIDDEGNVFPCERLTSDTGWSFGNIRNDSLYDILANDYRAYFVDQQTKHLPIDCRKCDYLDGCYNGCTHHRENLSPTNLQEKFIYCDNRKYMFELVRKTYQE